MKIKTATLAGLFIPIALLSEFYYIPVMGGYLRPIHLLAPLVIVLFVTHLSKLLSAPLLWILLSLLAVNLLTALISDAPSAAFNSFLLLVANSTIAISTAAVLASKRVSLESVHSFVTFSLIASVIWGIIQVLAFSLGGFNLGFSEQQLAQISAGFAPAFRTEANTFAKFINTAFLLTFPAMFSLRKGHIFALYAALVAIGLLITFTRSILYTLPLTLIIILLWYQFSSAGRLMTRRTLILASFFFAAFLIYSNFTQSISEYATHKIANFFSAEEVLSGDSSSLRIEWQMALVNSFTGSLDGFLFGTGWGQIFYHYYDVEMQPGGADILVFAAYGGVFSGLLYLAMIASALHSTSNMSRITGGSRESVYHQGIFFSVLGLTITGFVNGSLNSPEYWIVIGLAIFSSMQHQLRSARIVNRVEINLAS